MLGFVSGDDGRVDGDPCILRRLGAPAVRVEFSVDAPASDLEYTVARYAEAGTRVLPLAGLGDDGMPGETEAANLAEWADRFGPGGSFWAGRSDGALAITHIELGNESAYAQPEAGGPYARFVRETHTAIARTARRVGLLVQADDKNTNSPNWVDDMAEAVPELGRYVAAWTLHPYGPSWRRRIEHLSGRTERFGRRPIWVTEYGIASDNGTCMKPENYGWDPCMSYQEAADALASAILGMRDETDGRIRAAFIYQGRDQRAHRVSDRREHYFGALRHDGTRKGAYSDTVRKLWR